MIAAIRDGDEAAIGHAITKYSRLMWSIVSPILGHVASTQDMEECVADVFIYLWQNSEKYDPRRGKLKVWLSVVARSQAINKYRELTKRDAVPLDEAVLAEQLGVIDGILADETRRSLSEAVQALEEPDQEILIRRYYYEQKPKEIALALNMPVKHVENHLYRTRQKLRAMLS